MKGVQIMIKSEYTRTILPLALLLIINFYFVSAGYATTYYLSNQGNDNNSGTTENQPWRTLSKVNTFSLQGGDKVLFRRGDIFSGTLKIKSSGTAGNPITFGAYGNGELPIISGLKQITAWTAVSNGVYQSILDNVEGLNLVLLNKTPVALGRFPNEDYLTFEHSTGISWINDNELYDTPNWVGAEVVIRANHWILDRNVITYHQGGTLYFEPSTEYQPRPGFGYFIQSDLKTLDQTGEWYFKNGSLYLYFGSMQPDSYSVEAAVSDILVEIKNRHFIMLESLESKGANNVGIFIENAENITIRNCNISFSGAEGILTDKACNFIHIENNQIEHCLNRGIATSRGSDNITFLGNVIDNIGMLPGMGKSGDGMYNALVTSGANGVIRYNRINKVGYNGIDFDGDNTLVENNVIRNFCQIKDDGGAIYSFMEGDINFRFSGVKIQNNIILNGGGFKENQGINSNSPIQVQGIYCDGLTNSFEVSGNTIAFTASSGIYMNTPRFHTIYNNTLFNNKASQIHLHNFEKEGASPVGNLITNNLIFSVSENQYHIQLSDEYGTGIFSFGDSDSNKYITFGENSPLFNTLSYTDSWQNNDYNLDEWQSQQSLDLQSQHFSTLENEFRFEYNTMDSTKTVELEYPMIDLYGNKFHWNITLDPYSSALLFRDPNPDKSPKHLIDLKQGWNLFSSWLIPQYLSMDSVLNPLITSNLLVKVQDENGAVFEPDNDKNRINQIGDFEETEGYKINVKSDCTLEMKGRPVTLPLEIALQSGWNIISFPSDGEMDAMQVIQSLIDEGSLNKIQDEQGNSIEFWPLDIGWLNNIGNFKAGDGYNVKVTNPTVLSLSGNYKKQLSQSLFNSETNFYSLDFEGNGLNHMNINIVGITDANLQAGDEIAVFDGEVCTGAVKINSSHLQKNRVSIAPSMADVGQQNGFSEGNTIVLKLWKKGANSETEPVFKTISGELFFNAQTSIFIQFEALTNIRIYPNPSNGNISIWFSELSGKQAHIILTDNIGKQVFLKNITDSTTPVEIQNLPTGIYFLKTVVGKKSEVRKLIVNSRR